MKSIVTSHISVQEEIDQHIEDARRAIAGGSGSRAALDALYRQAETHAYWRAIADINTLIAWQSYLDSVYETAIQMGLRAAEQYEHLAEPGLSTLLYGVLGTVYSRTGSYHNSLRYFYRQRDLSQQLEDTFYLANANIGLAIVYSDIGEHDRALQYGEVALTLFTQLNNHSRMATVYMEMCHSYSEAGYYADALEAGHGGLALCNRESLTRIKGWLLYNMAIPLAKLGEPRAGLRSGLDALKIARDRDDLLLTTLAHVSIGRCYALLPDHPMAQQHFELALGLSIQLGTKRIAYETHEALAVLYQTRGDAALALHHYQQYMMLHHELFGEQVVTKLRNQEIMRQTQASQREADRVRHDNLELERRVAQRTQELEHALQREQQLGRELQQSLELQAQYNQLQSKIISTVSHAFRTPMTVIGASADLLEKFYDRMGPQKRGTQFQRIRTAIDDLTGMLQDAMWVNSVSTTNVELNCEPIEFGVLCTKLETYMRTQLRSELGEIATLTFDCEGAYDAVLHVDYHQLQQIVFNYVANGLKYGYEGGMVAVTLRLAKRHLEIYVQDDGLGIPADEIDGLFQLFVRGSNVESRRGLGLGLYTVRRLAEAMGGSVSAESPGLNQGSRFSAKIPTSPPQ